MTVTSFCAAEKLSTEVMSAVGVTGFVFRD